MARIKLEDVPYGYQDIYEGKADEAVENPRIEDIAGDAEQSIQLADPAPKTLRMVVMGNGNVGPNAFASVVDGHIGEGDAVIRTEFEYNVISADATEVVYKKVSREPIPK